MPSRGCREIWQIRIRASSLARTKSGAALEGAVPTAGAATSCAAVKETATSAPTGCSLVRAADKPSIENTAEVTTSTKTPRGSQRLGPDVGNTLFARKRLMINSNAPGRIYNARASKTIVFALGSHQYFVDIPSVFPLLTRRFLDIFRKQSRAPLRNCARVLGAHGATQLTSDRKRLDPDPRDTTPQVQPCTGAGCRVS
jgi:hypothetical protein